MSCLVGDWGMWEPWNMDVDEDVDLGGSRGKGPGHQRQQ